MLNKNDIAGTTALTLIESLLLAMNEHKILPRNEIIGLLQDAADTHDQATGTVDEVEMHRAAATLIKAMLTSAKAP